MRYDEGMEGALDIELRSRNDQQVIAGKSKETRPGLSSDGHEPGSWIGHGLSRSGWLVTEPTR